MARILILDGHTTQALACVRSLGRAGHLVYVASERRWPLAGASRYCRERVRLADQTLASHAALRAWAAQRGIEIVLPLTERSCVLCNAEAGAWRDEGVVLGCGPNEMLRDAFDKTRTIQHAIACGIPVPRTRFPTSLVAYREAARELGLPCVVKPRFSNAWDGAAFLPDPGVGYLSRAADLAPVVLKRRQGPHWPILQQYVRGQGKGVFALCDHGRPVLWFAHERLRDIRPSGSGSSLRRSVPLDPVLRDAASRLLAELSWHGPAMLEFIDDGAGGRWLMEVNGRFWGSLALAIAAGVDFPSQWVRLLQGNPVAPSTSYRVGVTLRWPWGDIKRLLHILRGPPRGYPDRYPPRWRGLRELLGPQPKGTRRETWAWDDPWPAVAEWRQGFTELLARGDGPNGGAPTRAERRAGASPVGRIGIGATQG
jgi:predicted ATP-grasp superfamily ATP-dependent carboligase